MLITYKLNDRVNTVQVSLVGALDSIAMLLKHNIDIIEVKAVQNV